MYKAETTIETENASRYLKALCNHFNRKVNAYYDGNHGTVEFGFADCEMLATENALTISIQAESDEAFQRVKFVIVSHLGQFNAVDPEEVLWKEFNQAT